MLIPYDDLQRLTTRILHGAGLPEQDASQVADELVRADARGVPSHGVMRTEIYAKRIAEGLVNHRPNLRFDSRKEGVHTLDADSGMGQIAGRAGMERAISTARVLGIGAVAVRNSSHFGQAGRYAELAADAGMIGFAFCNSAARMPAWGGSTATFGTNPIAIAAPTQLGFHVILDMATSATTLGRVVNSAKSGEPMPAGLALDSSGRPTTDPNEALKGVLLPLGGPKGAGLALMIDVLVGVISGSAFGRQVRSLYRDSEPEGIGNLFIALDVSAFLPLESYFARIHDLVEQVRGSDLAHGYEEIFLPGEKEQRFELHSRTAGVPVEDDIYAQLLGLVEKYGVGL